MNEYQLTSTVTALANALSNKLTVEEIGLVAAIFVQLGDTMATIATHRTLCDAKTNLSDKE